MTATNHQAPSAVRRATTRSRLLTLPSRRAVLGGLLLALAAVGAFVSTGATRGTAGVAVAVAARDLAPGEVLRAEDVRMVTVELPDTVGGLFGTPTAAAGRALLAPVAAGEFLNVSATAPAATVTERLELTLTVPAERGIDGLRVGDRVDVFSTWSGQVTELVAVDAHVLGVVGGDGLLATPTQSIRLGVEEFGQVEALVHAQAAGEITIVRAPEGSITPRLGRRYTPDTRSIR